MILVFAWLERFPVISTSLPKPAILRDETADVEACLRESPPTRAGDMKASEACTNMAATRQTARMLLKTMVPSSLFLYCRERDLWRTGTAAGLEDDDDLHLL